MENVTYVFLADGLEEIEALGTVDVLRRAGMNVATVSVMPGNEVTGAHGIRVVADMNIKELGESVEAEWLVCPGGMPGASNLAACERLCNMLQAQNAAGRMIAAICASPAVVLAPLGVLDGRKATCYPGFENAVGPNIEMTGLPVVEDGNVITANGPANTLAFALAIAARAKGQDVAAQVAAGMLYHS